jgi:hypothetical protein
VNAFSAGLLLAIENAGGFVAVDGRTFVRRGVLRDVLLAASRELCAEMLDRLMPIVGGHDAEENVRTEVGNIVRTIEEKIDELLPIIN